MANEPQNPSPENVQPPSRAAKWTRFPRERAAVVHLRAISPRARLLLAAVFDFVDADGLCWPSTELLAERSGLDARRAPLRDGTRARWPAVDRALKELRAARLLSWVRVEPWTKLPNGNVPRTRMRVLRVDLERVREAAGIASARRDQFDPFEGINLIPSPPPSANTQTPEIAGEVGTPDPLNCDLLVKRLTEQQPQEPHHPPSGVVVVGGDLGVERVVSAWLSRVWHWRYGQSTPALDEEHRVRGSIARRLHEDRVSESQLLDALEGARISPFCRGEVTGREVYGAGIFGGCLPRLIALGTQARRAEHRRQALAETKAVVPRAPVDSQSAAQWAALVPKAVRTEVLGALDSGSELPSTHAASGSSTRRT